ncbi:MAG: hypothetical protein V2I43_10980 [Parvularcula sp.]|jgi:hypothetical protein|nr:hypothetical protein [Parvularcula sp.]
MLTATMVVMAIQGLPPALDIPEAPLADDPFHQLATLETPDLREAAGRGAGYGIDLSGYDVVDIENYQNNNASLDGSVENSQVSDTQTGSVTDNVIEGNSGITTVFINSGNNVVLQSSVQINVYTPVGP